VKFAGKRCARDAAIRQDRRSGQLADAREGDSVATKTKKCLKCEDCYFRKNMLCALNLDAPCPTFRPAERGLAPERQLSFVFRTERTRAAYAFPAADARFGAPAAAATAQG
jgi:hypothetical protein